MLDNLIRLIDEIDNALFKNDDDAIKKLEPEVRRLETEKEFRDYVKKTLKDKRFHENFGYSFRDFPFSIIHFLDCIGIPPEESFIVQDIISFINIEHKAFIEYLIKEYLIQYFPQEFEDKILSDKNYLRLYNLTYGYE